jgi:thiol:disulfide interchange protein DsbD
MLRRFLGLQAAAPLAAGLLPLGAARAAMPPREPEPDHARARLIAERTAAAPGSTITLGLVVDMDEGWHVYWNGRNDTGYPVTVELDLPEGWTRGPTLYPPPERHIAPGGIIDHIYEGRVTLLIPVTIPADAEPATAEITGTADWLVCREACIPGDAPVRATIAVTPDTAAAERTADTALIEASRRAMPVALADSTLTAWVERDTLVIESAAPGNLEFYPSAASAALAEPIASAAVSASDGPARLTLAPAEGRPDEISGVASFRDADGTRIAVTIDGSALVRRAED